jgi:hypothetical protein
MTRWRSGPRSPEASALTDHECLDAAGTDAPDGDLVIEREMGCTRQELLGWLPGACGGSPFEVEASQVRIHPPEGRVFIDLAEAPPRRLGLLSLPVLRIRIRICGMGTAAGTQFLRRFDLHTRRGGG